ncbi:extracellular catalytic domain type 1 short-chain-length polyhydroxyalkanoate depolymerase [Polymorphobacter sp.]|uniref:extracellular catalytic domain type 1 short-chain-length polyhydroxyalkanoate depolymerase n=1 Tax=Polymorphobacter sp. TaxID=1909290 RepID=UPI003F6F64CE
MKIDPRMAEALALVRAGRPMDATRLLQGEGGQAPGGGYAPNRADATDIIDLVAEPATRTDRLHSFRSRDGEIGYRLHRPADLPSGAPLLVMLHGCTQTADDFALGTRMNARATPAGMAVLWPEQSTRANPRRCWRWFEAAHHRAEAGEPALLLALARQITAENALDTSGFFVAGMSAGGAMAAVLADVAPDQVRGVAVHSGLAAGAAGTMAGALAAMQRAPASARSAGRFVPMMVIHGDADSVVAPGNGDALFVDALSRAGDRLTVETPASRWGRLTVGTDSEGHVRAARLMLAGVEHSWAGGNPAGSHTSAAGPDASAEILRFFSVQQRHPLG